MKQLAAVAVVLLLAPRAGAQEPAETLKQLRDLRAQVGLLQLALGQREESLAAMRKDLRGLSDELADVKERIVSPVALPFLSGPPPSTDAVGVAKVAVFAPRVAVDSARRHDIVTLRVRRVEAAGARGVAEVELGTDALAVDLPLDQNGALYIVDWSTSEGHSYDLLLRDGSGGPDSPGGPPAATVQVKPLQSQGRFIFVGYRVD